MKIFFPVIILVLIISCQDSKKLFLLDDRQYHKFNVICDRDTILESKNGVKIIIQANTFECSATKNVELWFAAILNKSDMILSEIYSIDETGQYLESGGMFQILDKTNKSENFKNPIKLEIPTNVANAEMLRYSSKEINDLLIWSATERKVELKNIENIKIGKELFVKNCAQCHSRNFRNDLTGPALGNVHLFRDKDWLTKFTKNSMETISEGDKIATCLYQEWNKSLMNSFPLLSDKEIECIYEYIANESQIQGIAKSEINYLSDCEIMEEPKLEIESNVTFEFDSNYEYLLELVDNKWVNVDYLALVNVSSEIDPIVLNLDQDYENISIALAFQERNIVIPFVQDKVDSKKYSLWHPRKEHKIDFPLGEKVNIVAYTQGDDFQYKILNYQPKEKNNNIEFSMDFKEKKEFVAELTKL